MKIGDKVKHQSGSFNFTGNLLGNFVTSDGRRIWAVEQEGTRYCTLFDEYALNPISVKLEVQRGDDIEWFNGLSPEAAMNAQPVYIPPPKPTFPVKLFVPVKPLPAQAQKVTLFKNEVKLNYLTKKPFQSLLTEALQAELEFHFFKETSGDLDNLVKPVLDLLKGSIIYDDKQIKELSARFVCPSPREGFSITLHEAKR